jgi:hypothetical protein
VRPGRGPLHHWLTAVPLFQALPKVSPKHVSSMPIQRQVEELKPNERVSSEPGSHSLILEYEEERAAEQMMVTTVKRGHAARLAADIKV